LNLVFDFIFLFKNLVFSVFLYGVIRSRVFRRV
jgi:hypothetical protein